MYEQSPSVSRLVMGMIYGEKITGLKDLTSFGSCHCNSLTQEVPYTAAVTPTSETSVEIQASQSPGLRADIG